MIKDHIYKIVAQNYSADQYPCLNWLIDRWRNSSVLKGKTILVATPIFKNTFTQYLALLEAGAEVVIGCSNLISSDVFYLNKLREMELRVVSCDQTPFEVDLILDCAAVFSHWPATDGYVELTRSGVDIYKSLARRVFLADSGRVKRIETIAGTGDSYFRAMTKLNFKFKRGDRFLVFGSGKVGCGLILQARKLGLEICVVTQRSSMPDYLQNIVAKVIYLDQKQEIENAVTNCDYLVMATGIAGAFEAVCDANVLQASKAVCANMGAKEEFGNSVDPARVLEGKNTLNFILEEPTHLKFIDATLALHCYGAEYLVQNKSVPNAVLPPQDIEDKLVELSKFNIGNDLLCYL